MTAKVVVVNADF